LDFALLVLLNLWKYVKKAIKKFENFRIKSVFHERIILKEA
jgi:hypothetical protein